MSRRASSLAVFAAFFSLAPGLLLAQARSVPTAGTQSAPPSTDVPPFSVKVTGQGQPMILIPGLESSGAVWDGTVAHYAAAYQCHVLTLAGFAGQPPSPAVPFLASVRDAVATYIGRERLKTPVLVGHSLGGVLALSIAARYPDLVGKIVTIDGPPAPGLAENPNATPDQLKAMAEQAASSFVKMDRATRQKMLLEMMVTSPEHLKLMRSWGPSDPDTVRRALAEIITTDLRSDLARIQTPVLVVGTWVGHGPGADSASVARIFTGQFSQAKSWQLEMAPKARHFVMYDDPDWLFAKMDGFLRFPQPPGGAPQAPPALAGLRKHAAGASELTAYLHRQGARVVNMSWVFTVVGLEQNLQANGVGADAAERRKIAREMLGVLRDGLRKALASTPEILYVAGAGNSSSNTTFDEDVWASLIDLPNLVVAGAVDQAGHEASFTCFGPAVTVYSNGFQVESYIPGGERMKMSGTSMAAPNVTNLAAKLIALDSSLTPPEVVKLIRDGSDLSADGRFRLMNPKRSVELLQARMR